MSFHPIINKKDIIGYEYSAIGFDINKDKLNIIAAGNRDIFSMPNTTKSTLQNKFKQNKVQKYSFVYVGDNVIERFREEIVNRYNKLNSFRKKNKNLITSLINIVNSNYQYYLDKDGNKRKFIQHADDKYIDELQNIYNNDKAIKEIFSQNKNDKEDNPLHPINSQDYNDIYFQHWNCQFQKGNLSEKTKKYNIQLSVNNPTLPYEFRDFDCYDLQNKMNEYNSRVKYLNSLGQQMSPQQPFYNKEKDKISLLYNEINKKFNEYQSKVKELNASVPMTPQQPSYNIDNDKIVIPYNEILADNNILYVDRMFITEQFLEKLKQQKINKSDKKVHEEEWCEKERYDNIVKTVAQTHIDNFQTAKIRVINEEKQTFKFVDVKQFILTYVENENDKKELLTKLEQKLNKNSKKDNNKNKQNSKQTTLIQLNKKRKILYKQLRNLENQRKYHQKKYKEI